MLDIDSYSESNLFRSDVFEVEDGELDWSQLASYLSTELEQNYLPKVRRKAMRYGSSSLDKLRLSGEDLEASFTIEEKKHRVRMSLPIFDWNYGLSTISCSCQRDSLQLEEQRCEHMYLAQNLLLEFAHTHIQENGQDIGGFFDSLFEEDSQPLESTASKIEWRISEKSSEWYLSAYLDSNASNALSCKEFLEYRNLWSETDFKISSFLSLQDEQRKSLSLSANIISQLIDDPRLVFSDGSGIEWRREEFSIRAKHEDSFLQLSANLVGKNVGIWEPKCEFVFTIDKPKIYYAPINSVGIKLLEKLENKALELPVSSHDQLLFQLQRLNEAQIPFDFAQDTALKSHSACYGEDFFLSLRFTPFKNDFCKLEILIEFESSPLKLPVASGLETLIIQSKSSEPIRLQRDFFAERDQAERVIQKLGIDTYSLKPGGVVFLKLPDQLLKVLERVHKLKDLRVEWPKQSSSLEADFSLADPLEAKSLQLSVGGKKDWLEVGAEVSIDGNHVDLKALMDSLKTNNNYVRLADGRWARITQALREQLQALAPALEVDEEGLRLRPDQMQALVELEQNEKIQLEIANKNFYKVKNSYHNLTYLDESLPEGVQAELRPYQMEGYLWLNRLATWQMGACLADDMGLGKTLQTLCVLLKHAKKGPSVVVCPSSLCFNWKKELEKFTPQLNAIDFRSARSSLDLNELTGHDVLIVSYGLALREQDRLASRSWNHLILDEAQTIKNARSQTARAIQRLDSRWSLALSGTPIENHLGDLWSLFRTISAGLLGSWDSFKRRYGMPILSGSQEARERLIARVSPFILRRMKKDYLHELPEKIMQNVYVGLSEKQRLIYELVRKEAIEKAANSEQESQKKIQVLAALTKLRLACCHTRLVSEHSEASSAKLDLLCELLEPVKESLSQALVFSQFTSFLELTQGYLSQKGFTDILCLDGSTPPRQREAMIEAFQSGESKLFLISLKAGGTGLNLTAADIVIHLDPWWNPASEDQATDRAYRMGQKKSVSVYRLLSESTIEQTIDSLHQQKRDLADAILSNQVVSQLESKELLELIKHC